MKLRNSRIAFGLVVMTLAFLLGACSLRNSKPTVTITPPSGQANEGQEIEFSLTANDSNGVARVELLADDVLVDEEEINPPQKSITVPVQWIAVSGRHQITARAYNARNNASETNALFVSVKAVPTPAATKAATAVPQQATPTAGAAGCRNNAAFVADVTIPDGTAFPANQAFNKTWRVQNSGTCQWNNKYQLVFVSGERMATVAQVGLSGAIAPGQTADLLIGMTAPAAAGAHAGQWQLRDEAGNAFGPTLTVKIVTQSAVPAPQVSITSPANGFRNNVGDTIRVTFQGTGGTELASVALYVNGTQVAKQTSRSPVRQLTGTYEWKPAAGAFDLYAVAADIQGQQATSGHISGTIVSSSGCQAAVNFRADRTTINAGEHTTLRWDVECVKAIYLNNGGVGGHETRDIAPGSTTTYTLRVTKNDNSTQDYTVTITVNRSSQPTATPRPSQPTATPQPSQPTATPQTMRDIDGTWVSGDYTVDLVSDDGCGANCEVIGTLTHVTGGSPEIADVSGSFNPITGAVSWTADLAGGTSFGGTVSANSRTMSGSLSGVGNISFSKQ